LKKSFIDRAKITVKAGRGGDGCVSFRREKYVPRGGPDGGGGGEGGSVYLETDEQVGTLLAYSYQPLLRAENGRPGEGKKKQGRRGKSIDRMVPCGTLIIDEETGKIVADLVEPGRRLCLARGGKGGRGNSSFATSTRRAPRIAEKGEPGDEGVYYLELKLLAAVGLVGYPNAGKSTLLSSISHANPRIASYPFTTLSPALGIVTDPVDGYRRITVADIPGLIDGAHRNVGLGHEFLRHIERSRVLLFVLDMAGSDGRCPADDYKSLLRELNLYKSNLAEKPFLIAANKMDLPGADEAYREFIASSSVSASRVFPVSALEGKGLEELKAALFEITVPVAETDETDKTDETDGTVPLTGTISQ
jgi:GTPase